MEPWYGQLVIGAVYVLVNSNSKFSWQRPLCLKNLKVICRLDDLYFELNLSDYTYILVFPWTSSYSFPLHDFAS